ncbi:unnamed protein product [Orchesella dallaii]|uniref:U3 small nucleolar ribonucleoprotein protein MPP10 n=1 Tax=Orchesella dallaii TaxID=48710 RepID=A0ABP1PZK9_9HEXA
MKSYRKMTTRVDNGMSTVEVLVKSMQPEEFLSSSDRVSAMNLDLLKKIYDFTKVSETQKHLDNPLGLQSMFLKTSSRKQKKHRASVSKTEAPLFSLIIDGFDRNQIWEEVELQNKILYESVVTSTSKLLAYQAKGLDITSNDGNSENGDTSKPSAAAQYPNLRAAERLEPEGDSEDSDYPQSDKSYYRNTKTPTVRQQYPLSIVDDGFFSLAEMTMHIERVEAEMERAEMKRSAVASEKLQEEQDEASGAGVHLFEDSSNIEDDKDEYVQYFYQDFFDPPQAIPDLHCINNDHLVFSQTAVDDNDNLSAVADNVNELKLKSGYAVTEADEDMDENGSNTNLETKIGETVSSFEIRRRRIEENIQDIENEAFEPKSWQLLGETTADSRPTNALLEEHLVYDHLVRPAPDITVETTLKLEDVIKQRVKNAAWEDVQRKVRPIEDPREYKKSLVLSAEQSKASLTEIYEQEYLNKKKFEEGEIDLDDKEPEEHERIIRDMQCLFSKLDAMSHYHYTPKPVSAEVKIVTNVPAISMDDVAPVDVSRTSLLAPQEITDHIKGPFKSKEERTDTDKKRERRKKKNKQHLKRLILEDTCFQKGLGLRNIKFANHVVKQNKSTSNRHSDHQYIKELKSSKAFFAKLQDTVNTQIKNVTDRNRKRAQSIKIDPCTISAKKFKL